MQKALLELSAVNGAVLGSLTLQDVNAIASAVGIVAASIFSIVRTVVMLRDTLKKPTTAEKSEK